MRTGGPAPHPSDRHGNANGPGQFFNLGDGLLLAALRARLDFRLRPGGDLRQFAVRERPYCFLRHVFSFVSLQAPDQKHGALFFFLGFRNQDAVDMHRVFVLKPTLNVRAFLNKSLPMLDDGLV